MCEQLSVSECEQMSAWGVCSSGRGRLCLWRVLEPWTSRAVTFVLELKTLKNTSLGAVVCTLSMWKHSLLYFSL